MTLQEPESIDVKIVALMSVPMLGWNPHWGCSSEAVRPFKIPIRLAYGAYWHQSIQNLLQDCVDERLDWVLTMDYDSMFTARHLDRLLGQFGNHPHMDALAALQCKRSTDEVPLCSVEGVTEVEVNGLPFKANTAHFGLTLIRVEALAKMPLPWFTSRPDPDGSYRTLKRVDADIDFWHRWKDAGNTLYVDPMCSIGHLQPMVSEFDAEFKPRHTHVNDWRKRERGDIA